MDIKALQEKLSKLQDQNKGSGGSNIWLKQTEENQTIRMLPYPHNEKKSDPYIEVWWHYDIAGHRSIFCPKMNKNDPCPICKLSDEFLAMGGKENYYTHRNLAAKPRHYAPIFIRGKEEELGVKLWGFGKTIYEDLLTTSIDEGDVSDLKTGHDLVIRQIPVGAPGNDTTYPKPICKVQFKESIALENTELLKKLIKSIPNYLEDEQAFPCFDYEKLSEIVGKLKEEDDEIDVSDDDSMDEVFEAEYDKPSKVVKASTVDIDELDALLED